MQAYQISDDVPDLPFRAQIESSPERLGELTFSPEEDAKLDRAANRGPLAIQDALAGDARGIEEMKQLHVTRWEVVRRDV